MPVFILSPLIRRIFWLKTFFLPFDSLLPPHANLSKWPATGPDVAGTTSRIPLRELRRRREQGPTRRYSLAPHVCPLWQQLRDVHPLSTHHQPSRFHLLHPTSSPLLALYYHTLRTHHHVHLQPLLNRSQNVVLYHHQRHLHLLQHVHQKLHLPPKRNVRSQLL